MGGWDTEIAKETLFRILFVMRDSPHYSKSAMRQTIFLFGIDMLQVLRTLLSPTYGWSSRTFYFAQWMDVVHVGEILVTSAIPRVSLFVVSFLLVFVAIADALYCCRIFRAGEINSIVPIKLLRFLVTLVVTTLYSSTIKWLLMPLECLAASPSSSHPTFSELLHGDGAACTPWAVPEIAITVPTLLLTVFYVSFAITACFFSLGVNTLSECPRYAYTGRVELWYLASKVAATFTPLLATHTSPVLTPVLVFLCAARTLYLHLAAHPFQSHLINLLRGGTYTAMLYLALCSTILLGTSHAANDDSRFQTAQWAALGGLPLCFLFGFFLVHRKRRQLLTVLDQLQTEFDQAVLLSAEDAPSHSRSFRTVLRTSLEQEPRSSSEVFFASTRWQCQRFADGTEAVTAARVLLRRKETRNPELLAFVVKRGLEEHPESKELKVLNITLLRFLRRQAAHSVSEEKLVRNEGLPLDLQFLLYAVDRKAEQDYNAEMLGTGEGLNVVQVIELEKKMRTAHDAHRACVTEMKAFWQTFALRKRARPFAPKDFAHACNHLEAYHKLEQIAVYEYQTLRRQFPMSLQLLYEYASFAQGCLNDAMLHKQIRYEIEVLEGHLSQKAGHGATPGMLPSDSAHLSSALNVDAPEGGSEKRSDRKSDGSTALDSSYGLLNVTVFAASSFPRQALEVKRLWRVGSILVVLLLALTVAKFLLAGQWLYSRLAERDIMMLNEKDLLRSSTISLCFLCRSLQLAALRGDAAEMRAVSERMQDIASNMQTQHFVNALDARDSRLKAFYLQDDAAVHEVVGNAWREEGMTYLQLGKEVARLAHFVSRMTIPQLRAANTTARAPSDMDPQQAGLAFINENTFRAIIPRMEAAMGLYIAQTEFVWHVTRIAIGTWSFVDFSLLICLSLLTLALLAVVHGMHACYFAVFLAMSLPHALTSKLYLYYQRQESALLEFGDEGEAERAVMEQADGLEEEEDAEEQEEEEAEEERPGGGEGRVRRGSSRRRESCGSVPSEELRHADAQHTLTERNLRSLSRKDDARKLWAGARGEGPQHLKFSVSEPRLGKPAASSSAGSETPVYVGGVGLQMTAREKVDGVPVSVLGLAGHRTHTRAFHVSFRRAQPYEEESRIGHKNAPQANALAVREKATAGGSEDTGREDARPEGTREETRLEDADRKATDIRGWLSAAVHRGNSNGEEGAERKKDSPAKQADERGVQVGVLGAIQSGIQDGNCGVRDGHEKEEEGTDGTRTPPLELDEGEVVEGSDTTRTKVGSGGAQGRAAERLDGGDARRNEETRVGHDTDGYTGKKGDTVLITQSLSPGNSGLKTTGDSLSAAAAATSWCNTADDAELLRKQGALASGQPASESLLRKPCPENLASDTCRASASLESPRVSAAPAVGAIETQPEHAADSLRRSSTRWSLGMTSLLRARGGQGSAFSRRSSAKHSVSEDDERLSAMPSGSASGKGARTRRPSAQDREETAVVKRRESGDSRSGKSAGRDEASIQLRELKDGDVKMLSEELRRREPWVLRRAAAGACLLLLFALAILSTVFPASRMLELVSLAPTINLAGRRRFLAKGCAHLARELAIGDGYSRMRKEEVASALRYYLDQLHRADFEIKQGGDLEVIKGVDKRGEGDAIGQVMYGHGCPWRADPSNCSTATRPGAAEHGLHDLMKHFSQAVEDVLASYGPPPATYSRTFLDSPRAPEEVALADVWAWAEPREALSEDLSLSFVLASFDGDVFQGLDLVVELFDAYSLSVIGEAHVDNRLFFILYLLLLAAFYACLLRRAIAHARRRHEEGCCFARRIPTGALNGPEVNAVRCFVASDTVRKVLPKTSARTLILSLAVRPRAGTAELLRKSRSRSMDFNS